MLRIPLITCDLVVIVSLDIFYFKQKKIPTGSEEVGIFFGGPAYTFSKPENPAELIDDLVLLHTKLVDLGVVYRNGKVYLADLEETDV